MKNLFFILMVVFLITGPISAQKNYSCDTTVTRSLTGESFSVNAELKIKQNLGTATFNDVNGGIFSNLELKKLFLRKKLSKESSQLEIPTSLGLILKSGKVISITDYELKDGLIRSLRPEKISVKNSDIGVGAVFFSFLWIYLPLILMFKFFLAPSSQALKKSISLIFILVTAGILALGITLSGLTGIFLRSISGETFAHDYVVAMITGVLVLLMETLTLLAFSNHIEIKVSSLIALLLAGFFSGFFAESLTISGLGIGSHEFSLLYQYVGFYAAACLLTLLLAQIVLFFKKLNSLKKIKLTVPDNLGT